MCFEKTVMADSLHVTNVMLPWQQWKRKNGGKRCLGFRQEGKWRGKMSKIRKTGREKNKNNKNKKYNVRPPYLQVLPLLLLLFSSFFFFQVAQKFKCVFYMLIHKLLHLFLYYSSRTEVWITHILHVLNPQNTNRPPDSLGCVWPTKYVLTNFCIGVFSTV